MLALPSRSDDYLLRTKCDMTFKVHGHVKRASIRNEGYV